LLKSSYYHAKYILVHGISSVIILGFYWINERTAAGSYKRIVEVLGVFLVEYINKNSRLLKDQNPYLSRDKRWSWTCIMGYRKEWWDLVYILLCTAPPTFTTKKIS